MSSNAETTGAALFELDQCRRQFPELRLCQIIVNATGRNDPFYVTDDVLYENLMAYRKEYGSKGNSDES